MDNLEDRKPSGNRKVWLTKLLNQTDFLYLLIPIIVFCLGFLKIYFSIPFLALFIWLFIRRWKQPIEVKPAQLSNKKFVVPGLLILLWVFLSGIGGWAFQNTDFNGRNAFFRDLINYSWPVYYTNLGSTLVPERMYSFVYYFGFWLVPALLGKLFGWIIGNIALYFYTVVGVFIVVSLLAKKIKTSLLWAVLLLIFFSGMDILGVFIKQYINPGSYPVLWPPITHLEWWLPYQISSFTTELFWVVNQALPAWICTMLIINRKDNKSIFLYWSLCFFFAPIPALGLALLVVALVMNDLIHPQENELSKSFWLRLLDRSNGLVSFENVVCGGSITILMFLFFKGNQSTGNISWIQLDWQSVFVLIIFAILEWLLLWVLVSKGHTKDLAWYFMGIFLAISPLIDLTGTTIISKRATIPFMVLLMVWCGEIIFHERSRLAIGILLLVIIGAFTPIYEINRSIVRTIEFYQLPYSTQKVVGQCLVSQSERLVFIEAEKDHPGELLAEDWYSLSTFDIKSLGIYVNDTTGSPFFKYLAR